MARSVLRSISAMTNASQWGSIFIYLVAFTDEEKVDERAKLSVAAKRLLFRVRCAKWFKDHTSY